ncbi:hypothetical protein LTR78_010046 [Recurvomyces mirabilis]|uniref:CFEM domain-containing protein n=1 Tax=Recurvomyces mirabilis TaxID=574656 RepID=A0AAE0TQH2_9PEZI|nr:hypothetical protein LTR78_010046 [Recurvomyces mirabilis]KAK5149827.1 hypothetical protein LTS14_010648 [Recurvomyces mirabilis]
MRASITIAVLSASSALAVSLPPCASTCVSQGPGFGSCGTFDVKCICSDTTLLADLACCVSTACSAADQQNTIDYANSLCAGQGVSDLPQSATCSAGASGAASSTGSATGSMSSMSTSIPASVSSSVSSVLAAASSGTTSTVNSSAASSASASAASAQSSASKSAVSAQSSASSANSAAAASATSSSEAKATYGASGMGVGVMLAGLIAAI